jgi:hypothetical protein
VVRKPSAARPAFGFELVHLTSRTDAAARRRPSRSALSVGVGPLLARLGSRPQVGVPVSLSVDIRGGTADLDLGGVRVTELDVCADASVVEVSLPADVGQLTVAVLSKAAAVTIRVPHGVAAWIRGEKDIPELDIAHFRSWCSAGVIDRRTTTLRATG